MDALSRLFESSFVLADPTLRDRLFFVLTVARNEDFLIQVFL
jgi:hypothetical protein